MPIFNDALKVFNTDKSKWTIPKKGTTEYNEVMRIMSDLKANVKPKTKAAKETKKAKATKNKAPTTKTKKEILKPSTDSTMHG